jgi:hypothetical protein
LHNNMQQPHKPVKPTTFLDAFIESPYSIKLDDWQPSCLGFSNTLCQTDTIAELIAIEQLFTPSQFANLLKFTNERYLMLAKSTDVNVNVNVNVNLTLVIDTNVKSTVILSDKPGDTIVGCFGCSIEDQFGNIELPTCEKPQENSMFKKKFNRVMVDGQIIELKPEIVARFAELLTTPFNSFIRRFSISRVECGKFLEYLLTGKMNQLSINIGNGYEHPLNSRTQQFGHIHSRGILIIGYRKIESYTSDCLTVHYAFYLGDDVFVSKFGNGQVIFCSSATLLESYWPIDFAICKYAYVFPKNV